MAEEPPKPEAVTAEAEPQPILDPQAVKEPKKVEPEPKPKPKPKRKLVQKLRSLVAHTAAAEAAPPKGPITAPNAPENGLGTGTGTGQGDGAGLGPGKGLGHGDGPPGIGGGPGGSGRGLQFGQGNGPRFRHRALPSYPSEAKADNKEGKVTLRLTIDESGILRNVEIMIVASSKDPKTIGQPLREVFPKGWKELLTIVQQGKSLVDISSTSGLMKGKTVFVARKGKKPLRDGFRLVGAHCDTPRLDLKQHPLYEDCGVAQLKTHYYGGIRKHQWLARPLALHGVVAKKDGTLITVTIGEEPGDPVFMPDAGAPPEPSRIRHLGVQAHLGRQSRLVGDAPGPQAQGHHFHRPAFVAIAVNRLVAGMSSTKRRGLNASAGIVSGNANRQAYWPLFCL